MCTRLNLLPNIAFSPPCSNYRSWNCVFSFYSKNLFYKFWYDARYTVSKFSGQTFISPDGFRGFYFTSQKRYVLYCTVLRCHAPGLQNCAQLEKTEFLFHVHFPFNCCRLTRAIVGKGYGLVVILNHDARQRIECISDTYGQG